VKAANSGDTRSGGSGGGGGNSSSSSSSSPGGYVDGDKQKVKEDND
jgi:hypothetical protein